MFRQSRNFAAFLIELTNGRIVLALAFMLLVGLTEGLSLVVLIPLLTAIDPTGAGDALQIPLLGDLLAVWRPSLELLLLAFVLLIAAQAIAARAKSMLVSRVMHYAIDRLRLRLFRAVSSARWEVSGRMRPSDINHVMMGEIDRVRSATASILAICQSAVMLAVYIGLAMLVSWEMALYATLVGGILFAALYPIRRKAARFGQDLSRLFQRQNATMLEFLTGVRVAKSFLVENVYETRLEEHLTTVRSKTLGFAAISTWGTFAFQVATAIFAAAFVWLAVSVFALGLPLIAVLLLIFVRLAPRFIALQESVQTYITALPAFENVHNHITSYGEAAELAAPAGAAAPPFTKVIKFDNVSLTFDGADTPTLKAIDLKIRYGRTSALIGPSGSGKSTIADLVMGLLRPTGGGITVDGVPLTDTNRRLWRGDVAFVPQEPFLLNDTVEANLLIARPNASTGEVIEALRMANAGFVVDLKDGIHTNVGERGTRFSGGERQRIALARALLRKPDLLILDEATSALDWENQQAVAQAIAGLHHDITILTIAHRPSMIEFADDVIAVDGGRVVEQGSYAELAATPGSQLDRLLRGEMG